MVVALLISINLLFRLLLQHPLQRLRYFLCLAHLSVPHRAGASTTLAKKWHFLFSCLPAFAQPLPKMPPKHACGNDISWVPQSRHFKFVRICHEEITLEFAKFRLCGAKKTHKNQTNATRFEEVSIDRHSPACLCCLAWAQPHPIQAPCLARTFVCFRACLPCFRIHMSFRVSRRPLACSSI